MPSDTLSPGCQLIITWTAILIELVLGHLTCTVILHLPDQVRFLLRGGLIHRLLYLHTGYWLKRIEHVVSPHLLSVFLEVLLQVHALHLQARQLLQPLHLHHVLLPTSFKGLGVLVELLIESLATGLIPETPALVLLAITLPV